MRLLEALSESYELPVLALSKLDSISALISNAVQDDGISPEEFKLALDEMGKTRTNEGRYTTKKKKTNPPQKKD